MELINGCIILATTLNTFNLTEGLTMQVELNLLQVEALVASGRLLLQGVCDSILVFGITRNLEKLLPELKGIEQLRKGQFEVERKRVELCRSMADKDEKGAPIMEPVMTPRGPNQKFKGVNPQHPDIVALANLRDNEMKAADKIMSETKVKVELYMVPFEALPKDRIGALIEAYLPAVIPPGEATEIEKLREEIVTLRKRVVDLEGKKS